jgi:hypothetical protein
VTGYDETINKVEAQVYKQWQYGYGGVQARFDPNSLEIGY